jgi:hypothetical protein
MPQTTPDYFQPGYPVLSFFYALVTDQAFAQREHNTWQADHAYRGFLDNYQPFPLSDLVGETVPANGADSKGYFYPTPNQARQGIAEIFKEIHAATDPARSAAERSLAQLGGDRPVLRILGVVFTNQLSDPGFANVAAQIDALPADAALKTALRKLVAFRQDKDLLGEVKAPAVVDPVTAALVDELIGWPAYW